MLKRLRMVGWKSFEDAELVLGPFTLLVGANASGKSNVREALRFLHAASRGYNLAEIFGGKWSAGERQWKGIRGGVGEAIFKGGERITLEVEMDLGKLPTSHIVYQVMVLREGQRCRIDTESLHRIDDEKPRRPIFNASRHVPIHDEDEPDLDVTSPHQIIRRMGFDSDSPAIALLDDGEDLPYAGGFELGVAQRGLQHMRFVDPSPRGMRQSSMPGQTILSDRGENLSSVLQSLCSRDETKSEIIHWLRALTPMDVADLKFDVDRRGQVLLILVENDGTEISADSASEGTLRFLGLLAALMSPEPGLYFFEEIENGLHPSRLRLLIDLIRERTSHGEIQVVATTHSPVLLALLPDELLEHASLVVRPEDLRASRIIRLLDVPDAPRVLRDHDRAELFASGWFEDMVEFGESKKLANQADEAHP